MPWRYHIRFARCLYSYRDDLPETVGRSIAHEWKTSTSSWHAQLPSDYCGQVAYPGGNVVCWVEFVVGSNCPPLASVHSFRSCFCAFESFGGEVTILAALPTSSQPLIQNFPASRERSRPATQAILYPEKTACISRHFTGFPAKWRLRIHTDDVITQICIALLIGLSKFSTNLGRVVQSWVKITQG